MSGLRNIRHIRWIVLYVVILTAAIVYSVRSGGETAQIAEPDKLTLTFRHFWTKEHDRPILEIFEDVIGEFQRTHPNVKVNFEGLDQTIHREQKLKSEMVTGTPPDLFVLFGGAEFVPYASSNRLLDLTDFIRTNELEFRDLKLWTYDGSIYGLPFEGYAEPIFYNRTIFDELGLKPPETLDELTETIRVLRRSGYIPFALGNMELWPGAIYAHYLMDRYAGPAVIERLATGDRFESFGNPKYMHAFRLLRQWSEEGAFNEQPISVSTEEAIALFTERKAAMYLNGSWDITLFRSADGSDQFQHEIGVLPFPALMEGDQPSIAGGYSIGIGLSSNLTGPYREAALDLLKAFFTEEVQMRIVYEGLRLPSMTIPFDPARTGPVFTQVLQLMEQSEHTFIAYDNVLSPEVRRSFLSVVGKLLEREMTDDEAAQELDAASDAYWKLRNS